MPTTSLNASSSPPARCGSTSLTLERTSELRTIGVTPSIREPETATPSAQATIRTAQALSAAPPIASSARAGCQVIRSRILAPRVLQQTLPQRGGQDHDEQRAQRDQQRRVGVAERDRRQPDAEEAAEQQARGGEGAGDEALPVAGDGVGEHQHHQQPVEEVHPRRRSSNSVLGCDVLVEPPADQHVRRQLLLRARRGGPRSSRGTRRAAAMMPAVNPQQMTSWASPIRKPGLRQPARAP